MKFDRARSYAGGDRGQRSGPAQTALHRYHPNHVRHRSRKSSHSGFDESGKYLAEWPNLAFPNSILITAGQEVWVSDGTDGYSPSALSTHTRLLKYSVNGRLLSWWGAYGTEPGTFWENHSISADAQGNFYVADSYTGRTQKFRPKPGADRSKLVAAPLPLMSKAER